MNEPYEFREVKEDGTRTMTVRGVEFDISAQSLPDDEWQAKLQAKADAFAATIRTQVDGGSGV
jgi:hypothetical protein